MLKGLVSERENVEWIEDRHNWFCWSDLHGESRKENGNAYYHGKSWMLLMDKKTCRTVCEPTKWWTGAFFNWEESSSFIKKWSFRWNQTIRSWKRENRQTWKVVAAFR